MRFAPSLGLEEMMGISLLETISNTVLDIPFVNLYEIIQF